MDFMLDRIKSLMPLHHNFVLGDGTCTRTGLKGERDYPLGLWRRIKDMVGDVTGRRCLDVGCNAGWFSLMLARRGAQVTGVELDPNMVEAAQLLREYFGVPVVEFHTGDFLEVAEGQYDLILFMGVYYHLPNPDSAFVKLRSLLKDGGRIIVESACGAVSTWYDGIEKVYDGDATNHLIPAPSDLVADMEQAGFSVRTVDVYAGDRVLIEAVAQ